MVYKINSFSDPAHGNRGKRPERACAVFIIGTGGLCSPEAMYLAAVEAGTVSLADWDHVETRNLHRQILHRARDIGFPKVESGKDAAPLQNSIRTLD
ncbi:MAG TPA: ThiF family adenylyltransferase [Thermodesulfobacteriota bacterium]|nr:ThiF family adenylyltransferase [Thermodesulfobacteriota bacterium]